MSERPPTARKPGRHRDVLRAKVLRALAHGVSGDGDDAWPIGFADLGPAVLWPVAYAAVGGLLWLVTLRRFEKEGRL